MFLCSAVSEEGKFLRTNQIIAWLATQNDMARVKIEKIKFDNLKLWETVDGRIRHSTEKFFSIDGIDVQTNWGDIHEWQQPIIDQPEIGYLGFIVKEFDGVLHLLAQAKIEPGNVNRVQLSTTLQATRSNYTQAHHGNKPPYLEYFQNAKPHQILLDQLQSEQGARFLKKRNRSIIVKIEDDIPVYDNFTWLTLGQLKKLIHSDNLVNTAARTVISSIPFDTFESEIADSTNGFEHKYMQNVFLKSTLSNTGGLHSIDNIISFLTNLKSIYDLAISQVPLEKLEKWIFGESEICHEENKYFKVIAVHVEIAGREVAQWDQPMIEAVQNGLCAFVCKPINGLLHFAVQAKLECGNHDILEFAPTVQCLTGNYRQTEKGALPFLDYILSAKPEQIIFDAMQSEEGGRFFREQNRNMIVLAEDDVSIELPDNYIWMTLHQLRTFMRFNNYLNIQARNLISAISFV